jgi:hypothetical protein
MKTELVLLGRHINMASQARRRQLVVVVYSGFAVLMLAGWLIDRWRLWGATLIIFLAPNVSRMVFGGYGTQVKGLLKPFLGNEIRTRYARNPDSPWSRLCRLTIPQVADGHEFCSDERELRRRDSAHEAAYRRLGMVAIFTFLIAYLKNASAPVLKEVGVALPAAFFDLLIYGLLIAAFILFITLPQAILLWTEPDMEEQNHQPA